MNIISEEDLIQIIKTHKNKKVLLIEPNYVRKHIPLGIAKLSMALKQYTNNIDYSRNFGIKETLKKYDSIFITTLFTYYSDITLKNYFDIRAISKKIPIYFGGIFASIMPKYIEKKIKEDQNTFIFTGYSKYLDNLIPDYSLNYKLEQPWNDFNYIFTTRGCPNNCPYCVVKKVEKEIWICENWKEIILNSPNNNILIYDNNLSHFPEHFEKLSKILKKIKKKVLFDNGFDCKLIDNNFAKLLSGLRIYNDGIRVAFDRIEEDGIFQKSVKILIKNGISPNKILSYVLFNFNDTPQEANYRMEECKKLKIRPYPQRFSRLDQLSKKDKYVGKYWSENLLKHFRRFWLMRSIYSKITFDEYIKSNKKEFTKDDMNKWDFKK